MKQAEIYDLLQISVDKPEARSAEEICDKIEAIFKEDQSALDFEDENGFTFLHYLINHDMMGGAPNNVKIAIKIVELNQTLLTKRFSGMLPIECAMNQGVYKMVQALIPFYKQTGLDIQSFKVFGEHAKLNNPTLLSYSLEIGRFDIAEQLFDNGFRSLQQYTSDVASQSSAQDVLRAVSDKFDEYLNNATNLSKFLNGEFFDNFTQNELKTASGKSSNANFTAAIQKVFKNVELDYDYTSKGLFNTGNFSVKDLNDLKDLPVEKRLILIQRDPSLVYRNRYISVSDITYLSKERIELLTSFHALEAYNTGKVSVKDLKNLPEIDIWQKIATAILTHISPQMDISGINEIKDILKIRLLISDQIWDTYKTGKVSVADLKDLPEEKIKLLTSYDALRAYETGKVSAADLKDLPEEKIKLLLSYEAREAYKTGEVSAADLKDLPEEKIKLLLSPKALCLIGEVSVADLKDFSEKSLELLFKISICGKLEQEEGIPMNDEIAEIKSKLSNAERIVAERMIASAKSEGQAR